MRSRNATAASKQRAATQARIERYTDDWDRTFEITTARLMRSWSAERDRNLARIARCESRIAELDAQIADLLALYVR